MSDHVQRTIADLQKSIAEEEQRLTDKKRLANQLAEMAGIPPVYADANHRSNPSVNLSIRSDQFYGQPLATCVRDILGMRKALDQGAASVNEIHAALIEGGFAFDTKNEENSKRGLRISIAKNTALFHKLPNGKIGLREWYPNAKSPRASRGAVAAEMSEGDEPDETENKEQ